jgi:hypothetical protein
MAPGSRPEIDALTVQVRPNEAIAENDEKNRAEAPSMRRRKMVAPGWGLAPKVRWRTETWASTKRMKSGSVTAILAR